MDILGEVERGGIKEMKGVFKGSTLNTHTWNLYTVNFTKQLSFLFHIRQKRVIRNSGTSVIVDYELTHEF